MKPSLATWVTWKWSLKTALTLCFSLLHLNIFAHKPHHSTDSASHVTDPTTQIDFCHRKATSSTGAPKTRRKMLLRWSTWKKLAELSLSGSEHNGGVK
ncbi:hypothetical protein ACSQ67_004914 [Phaseolus vulgaris]